MNSAEYLEEKDGMRNVTVDILFFGEYNFTLGLEMAQNGNGWIINDVFNIAE